MSGGERYIERMVRQWEAADRRRGRAFLRERQRKNQDFWRMAEGSFDAVYARINDPRRFPTPQATIEAIMHCVRERGLPALEEPSIQVWLSECDEPARKQINERIERRRA